MDTLTTTARQAYQLEQRADIQIARINDRLKELHAEQHKWVDLSRAARDFQNYLADPEAGGWDGVEDDLNDALDALGLSRAAMSYVPAGAM